VSGALGVEVRGIDLESPDDRVVRQVTDLVHEHLVAFFPDQHLSVAGHHRLGSALGEIVENSYTPSADDDYPGVTVHRSEDGYVADVWHSDGQPRPAPVKFTIFKMITAPSRGGDTAWVNQYRVYERLSPPLRDLLDGLTALQRSLVNPDEQSTHPAVIVHPETGRKLLYVSKAHTVRFLEMSEAESRALIDHLVDVALQPENVCRYTWAPGTVGMWDNLATVHYGVNDFDEPRMFHRVMVQGPVLPDRVDRWPVCDDTRPRTMVRKDGTAGVVGQMTERLWPADQRA
jgi:alpha-ketoglutarate-dependent taurine dioxygenase